MTQTIVILLIIAISILLTGIWHMRLHEKESKFPILLGILIGVLEYVIIQYLTQYSKSEMLKMLWVRVAIAMLIPILVLGGPLNNWSRCGSALVISGVILLLINLSEKD